ncbi:hypothetical protein ETD86_51790 [Nonomuraea turkmeniaca]|uniref:DUF3800 domain-containing protein n=2 Tax=Nonomuraea turkmeniaca TaxID=103838 RepID=A0A5S4EVF4_9ACTN|nr:hypothetical protein ETD86_51790 [Nonomuraea turkmeniaca]
METTQTSIGHTLEIACDESGWEGSNLTAGNSDVIAHASVRLDINVASECIRALRGRSRQHSYEYKASHLLRTKSGSDLAGFLGPSGPVHGRAMVHLTHKSCFVLGRVLDLFIGGSADAASLGLRPDQRLANLAATLCRAGPDTFGREPWQAFLTATNVVLRADRHRRVRAPVDAFFGQVEALRALAGGRQVGRILDELRDGRREAYAARARLLEDRALQPVLEPLLPALARAVLHWSGGLHPVAVVHDEQSALTERRMRRLEQILAAPPLEMIRLPAQGRFIRFRQADSRTDPRVQVADVLAGVARKIVTDDLLGRSDPGLTALLRPYVDPASRWCEQLADPSGRTAG